MADFRARLLAATTKHLDLLIDSETKVAALKGKSADGATATGVLPDVRADRQPEVPGGGGGAGRPDREGHEGDEARGAVHQGKGDGGGEAIAGGGPPAFGWYTASAAYILHKEGGRDDDIKYIATVIDNFPWNENGWWANTIDIKTGQPKEPLTKAGAINKSAAMAMCAGMVGGYVKAIDPELSARLKAKADKCVYKQIIPAQEADGFWHYGFKGTDPKNKDVLGYFMVTTAGPDSAPALHGLVPGPGVPVGPGQGLCVRRRNTSRR